MISRTTRISFRCAGVLLLAWLLSFAPGWAQSPVENPAEGPALGSAYAGARELPGAQADAGTTTGSWIMFEASWADIERTPGEYDWQFAREAVDQLAEGGFRVAVRLVGPRPAHMAPGGIPRVEEDEVLPAWLSFARSAVRGLGAAVEGYQIWDSLADDRGFDPAGYSFLLKNSALALRAEARKAGLPIRIAQAPIQVGELTRQQQLWELDVAPYIDILPVRITPGQGTIQPILEENVLHPPASRVWAVIVGDASVEDASRAGAAIESLAAGADAAIVTLAEATDPDRLARWVVGAARLLVGQGPAPAGNPRIRSSSGEAIAGARWYGRFLGEPGLLTRAFYRVPGERQPFPAEHVRLDTLIARQAKVIDPLTGEAVRVAVNRTEGGVEIGLLRDELPLVLEFESGAPGTELPVEEIETTTAREPTAEEIIAQHQGVQQLQADRLHRFTARGRLSYRFKFAQGGSTIDVTIDSNYFWERGGRLEWEQTDYFINGNHVGWKTFPRLPLIQPEKVITLPLDLTLDRTYTYRKVGREPIDGRDAWVLEFQPGDPDAPLSLYRGRIWIDAESFVRLKVALIQTRLEAPVLSNEETDRYAPLAGPDGEPFWLITSIAGQQTWSAAGRTFVVQRELTFENFQINPDAAVFEEQRNQAYASKNQMMADTENGFRYLERQEDGSRVVKEKVATSQLFAAAGAVSDASISGVQPLGGVNYFNYDLWGKNIQVNAFFAGVLGFFTASKPDLFNRNVDFTVDMFASAIKFGDEVFLGDAELVHEKIDERPFSLSARMGIPLGQFWKVTGIGRMGRNRYFHNEDSDAAIAGFNASSTTRELTFVLPAEHTEWDGTLRVEFNRRGFNFLGQVTTASRSDWTTWGLQDRLSGEFGRCAARRHLRPRDPEPIEESFDFWQLSASREWFFGAFQKVRGEISYLDGRNLDRFSRYQFSQFGSDRLFGFAGTGVRFDEGLIGRTGYSFNVLEAVQLDLALESAWVSQREDPAGTRQFTGIGLSGNTVGPWKTVISLNYGYAIQSDIPSLEGEQEFLLLILKLF